MEALSGYKNYWGQKPIKSVHSTPNQDNQIMGNIFLTTQKGKLESTDYIQNSLDFVSELKPWLEDLNMGNYIFRTDQPGPGASRKKFNELTSPIWTFFVKQSFFSNDLFRFWSLG